MHQDCNRDMGSSEHMHLICRYRDFERSKIGQSLCRFRDYQETRRWFPLMVWNANFRRHLRFLRICRSSHSLSPSFQSSADHVEMKSSPIKPPRRRRSLRSQICRVCLYMLYRRNFGGVVLVSGVLF